MAPFNKSARVVFAIAVFSLACDSPFEPPPPGASLICDSDNGGITLPVGFCAVVVADLWMGADRAAAQQMAVMPNGDIFVAVNSTNGVQPQFGIIALRDVNGDGHSDTQRRFSPNVGGSGLTNHNGYLYLGADDRVVRYHIDIGTLVPSDPGVVIVNGFPAVAADRRTSLVIDPTGQRLFMNVGSQGVRVFDAMRTDQPAADGWRYSGGNCDARTLAMHPNDDLYGALRGRVFSCKDAPQEVASFSARVEPNGLYFYSGGMFPDRYRDGAFVTLGGIEGTPDLDAGYKVMFVPMDANRQPAGPPEIFADGFAGSAPNSLNAARHRPVGLREGPDGSLYISDDIGGRIWRVVYRR